MRALGGESRRDDEKLTLAEASEDMVRRDVAAQAPRRFPHDLVTDLVPKGGVHLPQATQQDEDQGERCRSLAAAQRLLQPPLRKRPVGKTRQGIVERIAGDISLAVGDRLLHRVERGRQTAELLAAGCLHRRVITAVLNALRRTHELAQRTRSAPPEEHAYHGRQHDGHAVDEQK